MNTAENTIKSKDIFRTLRQVSLIFFFIIGSAHILTGLFASENMFLPTSNIINRVLDIPFILIGGILAFSQAHISSDSSGKKAYIALMLVFLLLLLGLLLYINLFLPDKPI